MVEYRLDDAKVIGIVAISLPIPVGSGGKVAEFYAVVLGFDVDCVDGRVRAKGGPVAASQEIAFFEQANVDQYSGDHFCMYITDFEKVFERYALRKHWTLLTVCLLFVN